MKFKIISLAILLILFSCSPKKQNPMIGTWQLLSSQTIKNDTTIVDNFLGRKMIKIINESHFAFLNHDVDSNLVFVAGGGTYSIERNQYMENLQFCNYREWENHTFNFEVAFSGDTMIQKGVEELNEIGVKQTIIETYVKVK